MKNKYFKIQDAQYYFSLQKRNFEKKEINKIKKSDLWLLSPSFQFKLATNEAKLKTIKNKSK